MPRRNLTGLHHFEENEERKPFCNGNGNGSGSSGKMHSQMEVEEDGSPSKLCPKPGNAINRHSSDQTAHDRPYPNGGFFKSAVSSYKKPVVMAALVVLSVFFIGFKAGETTAKQAAGPKKYEKFIIFSQQRSGSKFLTSLMNNHPSISCGNEELLHLNITGIDIDMYMKMVTGTYTQLLEGTSLHSPTSTAHLESVTHLGFKIMYDQGLLQFEKQLLAKLDELGIKVIHLVRRNKILQYVSYAANKKDRLENAAGHVPHPTTEAEIKALAEIRVPGDPKQVFKYMEKKGGEVTEASNILAKYLEQPMLSVINYEDLSANTDEETARLFEFLGVPVQKVGTDLAKIHKDKKIHEYFEEEDQDRLRDALKESEFSWILDNW